MATGDSHANPETRPPFHIGGCLVSGKPSGFPKFGAVENVSNEKLPASVDLRIFMTNVEYQAETNSCVANAIVGALEFLIKKRSKKNVDISRLFIYYNSRLKHTIPESNIRDNGTYIWTAVAALKEFGSCKECLYKFNPAVIDKKPPDNCYLEARKYLVTDAMSLELNLGEMKSCLAIKGYPFVFALYVYDEFMFVRKDGQIPMPPSPYRPRGTYEGWHAMLAVGYSDKMQCFFVKNSFGETWGNKGYCYIPYEYMCNPHLCNDLHVIKLVGHTNHSRKEQDSGQIQSNDNDPPFSVLEEVIDDEFNSKYFWNYDDTFDYIINRWRDRREKFVVPNPSHPHNISSYDYKVIFNNNAYPMRFIVWIDNHHDITNVWPLVVNNRSVQIDFYETLSAAEVHLSENMSKIVSSSTFQIICRGYYPHEDKNPLNLLKFLNHHKLQHIPVRVFTNDKVGVIRHLQRQAPSMGINDWRQRLIIIDNSDELAQKCRENMKKH